MHTGALGAMFTMSETIWCRYYGSKAQAFGLSALGDQQPGERIGKLAAIAVIRTALNYFLSKELKDERASEEPALRGHPATGGKD